MRQRSVMHTDIRRIDGVTVLDTTDVLAIEEPLEIRIEYGPVPARTTKSISVTMRTPGNDSELASGFLFTEGIIKNPADINTIFSKVENVIHVALATGIEPEMNKLERNFYTTSSCGVCGKASIEAVKTTCDLSETYPYDNLRLGPALLSGLSATVSKSQDIFEQTGGIHAAALFNTVGELLLLREDVGRHNALDKLIGAALEKSLLPLNNHILYLSGRASFELVQKAAMAGIKVITAVGAPSSLAVQMAEEWGMTLIGFLRGHRFNIYSGTQRVVI